MALLKTALVLLTSGPPGELIWPALPRPFSELLGWAVWKAHRITRLVLGNLESQEFMHSLHGPRTTSMNSNPASRVCRFKVIVNLIAQFGHRWHSRRRFVVNEHWNFEIAVRKHLCDVREMLADLIPHAGVLRVIASYFYCATVRQQSEMVSRRLLRKSHTLLASLHHFAVGLGRTFLGHLLLGLNS